MVREGSRLLRTSKSTFGMHSHGDDSTLTTDTVVLQWACNSLTLQLHLSSFLLSAGIQTCIHPVSHCYHTTHNQPAA